MGVRGLLQISAMAPAEKSDERGRSLHVSCVVIGLWAAAVKLTYCGGQASGSFPVVIQGRDSGGLD